MPPASQLFHRHHPIMAKVTLLFLVFVSKCCLEEVKADEFKVKVIDTSFTASPPADNNAVNMNTLIQTKIKSSHGNTEQDEQQNINMDDDSWKVRKTRNDDDYANNLAGMVNYQGINNNGINTNLGYADDDYMTNYNNYNGIDKVNNNGINNGINYGINNGSNKHLGIDDNFQYNDNDATGGYMNQGNSQINAGYLYPVNLQHHYNSQDDSQHASSQRNRHRRKKKKSKKSKKRKGSHNH